MVTELQFVAIAAFLFWCLVSSLCGVLEPTEPAARLIWRQHGTAGWGRWREAHFGLTAADRRILFQPEPAPDPAACRALLDTVLHQAIHPESSAVQFAIVRGSDRAENTVVFVSDVHSMALAN